MTGLGRASAPPELPDRGRRRRPDEEEDGDDVEHPAGLPGRHRPRQIAEPDPDEEADVEEGQVNGKLASVRSSAGRSGVVRTRGTTMD